MGGLVVSLSSRLRARFWFLIKDYQRERILTLFNPERDPLGSGWNIIQSTIAIGSGGLSGKGLLQGTQSHLDFCLKARPISLSPCWQKNSVSLASYSCFFATAF